MGDPFQLIGTTIDNDVRVDAVVGEGGFGVVYKGWHGSFDVPVAIKVMKLSTSFEGEQRDLFLKKFQLEAKILYTLSQATLNVVRALSFGSADTVQGLAPFCVLEWLDGRTLDTQLAERRRLIEDGHLTAGRSVDSISELIDPLVEALAEAHGMGVVHRDIKPANVFLTGGTGGPRVKLLDFGIAKIVDLGGEISNATTLSKGTLLALTPEYAAPEQWDRSIGEISPRTDIYSVALMAVELLSDRRTAEGLSPSQCMFSALNQAQRPTPRRFGVTVPDALEAVFARALAVDPLRRPASVKQWWAEAKDAAGSAAVTMAPAPQPPGADLATAATVPGASPPATGPGAESAATMSGAVPPFLRHGNVGPGRGAKSPEQCRRERRTWTGVAVGIGVAVLAAAGIYAASRSSDRTERRVVVIKKEQKTGADAQPREQMPAPSEVAKAITAKARLLEKHNQQLARQVKARRCSQAKETVAKILQLDPDDGRSTSRALALACKQRPGPPPDNTAEDQVAQLLTRAQKAYETQVYPEAIQLGLKVLALKPNSQPAQRIVGFSACRIKDYAMVVKIFPSASAHLKKQIQEVCRKVGVRIGSR